MSERFRIATTKNGTIDLIFLIGRLDGISAPKVEECIMNLIQTGSRQICIHGGEMSYISSAALRVFLAALMKIREYGGDIRLSNLMPEVREVFVMSGFDEIFAIYPEDTAVIVSYSS